MLLNRLETILNIVFPSRTTGGSIANNMRVYLNGLFTDMTDNC